MAPRLLAISDRATRAGTGADRWLASVVAAGVDAIQVRDKDLGDRDLLALALACRRQAGPALQVIVNGRADIAVAAGCDGVHLTSDGPPVAMVRSRFGETLLVGRSTHHPAEVAQARREGADYVTFGPVFPTPSKAGFGPPPGLEGLREACRHGVPVLALGGVDVRRLAAVADAGAAGIAFIRSGHGDALADLVRKARQTWPPPDRLAPESR